MTGRPPELPTELRAFLYACVDAVEQVDILIHLQASGRVWTAKEVSIHEGIAEHAARAHLEALVARGLLRAQAGASLLYSYAPKTDRLKGYVELLATHYAGSRSLVVSFVATQTRGAVKTFADAFKLRDEEQ